MQPIPGPSVPLSPMRQRLLDLVNDQPGINKSGVCGRLGVAWGTVAYHVAVLAKAGLVQVEAEGREASLFPQGITEDRRRLLKALREPAAHEVLGALAAVRESGLLGLSARLGLSRKVVRRHLSQLLAAGLVQDKGSRRPRYALAKPDGPSGPHPLMLDRPAGEASLSLARPAA